MRSLANISCILVVLVLIGCLGCNGGRASRAGAPGQQIGAQHFPATDNVRVAAVVPLRPAPAPVQQAAGAKPGQYTFSRIYPCSECGHVRLDKVMPSQVELNRHFSYTIKVTNLTGATLKGIVVSEELPDAFELTGAEPTAEQDGKTMVWEIDSLGPKASVEITASGIPKETETLEYCTNVVTPSAATCAKVDVIEPRLKLAKSAPQGALVCDPIRVQYVVTNIGTGPAQEVKIVDTLADGLVTSDGKSELVIIAGTLLAGQVKEFSAELRARKTGEYVSKAVARSADGLEVESEATTTVVDQPVLTITQTGAEKLYVGRSVTYEITVANTSEAPATNAVIENAIPAGVTSMKASAGARLTNKKIVWPLGTLAPNTTRTVYVSFAPTKAGTLTNKVTATAHCADAVTVSAQTTIAAIPAVLMEVIDIADPVEVGGRTTYVITVTNQGSAPSTNIGVVCVLEENVRYVSSTGSTVGSIENGTLTFSPLAKLAPKARAIWRVVVTALKPGDTRFKATINTDELTRPVEETEATRVYE